jgi:hypothetical protein
MPNIYENDVIRYLRRKGATGFTEPVSYLGSEQRFVTALRNSSVNNLEEQYLLGTDTYTEVYEDSDENIIVEKSFHINSDTPGAIYSDYYKLITTVYKDNIDDRSFYFENNKLIMPEDINKVIFGNGSIDYPDLNTLYGVDENTFDFVNDTFNIYPSEFSIVRKDELFFITDSGATIKPVLTKTISKRYEKTGGKVIYREDITNHLT